MKLITYHREFEDGESEKHLVLAEDRAEALNTVRRTVDATAHITHLVGEIPVRHVEGREWELDYRVERRITVPRLG